MASFDIGETSYVSPFLGALNLDPLGQRALFESFVPQRLFGAQRRQVSNLFAPTFNRFLGQLGQQLLSGEGTTPTFKGFLENQFDPVREQLRLPTISSGTAPLVTPTMFNFPV